MSVPSCGQFAVCCLLSAAVAMLFGNSMTSGADDLDTTLPNVMLDQSDLDLPDVGVSDDESDGKQTVHIFSDFNSPFCFAV